VIRSLLRALEGGTAAKAALDAVVDVCAAMQARTHRRCPVPLLWLAGGRSSAGRRAVGSGPATHDRTRRARRHPRTPKPCSRLQNLREAIGSYRGRLQHEANDARKQGLLQVRRPFASAHPAAASQLPI
jgi:hypothetical protein